MKKNEIISHGRKKPISKLRQRMLEDMELRGYSPRTQGHYLEGVRALARHYKRSPDRINEEEIRQYFLYLKHKKKSSPGTIIMRYYGIRFFCTMTLNRNWRIFDIIKPPKRQNLPVVLSRDEVTKVLSHVRKPIYRMCLILIYSCGLRVGEAVKLTINDIDSSRMMIRVEGKGGKLRDVPLPNQTLNLLRQYWHLMNRPRPFLFPSSRTGKPINRKSVEEAFRKALEESGIGAKKNAKVHTLRHSYATHLMENQVNFRIIQDLLGHKNPKSTAIYTHLSQKTDQMLNEALNHLMGNLKL